MDTHSTPLGQIAVLTVVIAVVLMPLTGVVTAQTDGAGETTYVAVQGEQCTPMNAFAGNESARTFYDYRLPYPDNPYINTTGNTYGSEGMEAFQRANTSVVFLYRDTNGTADGDDDTLSLVFVHGEEGNANSTGGSASFEMTGLPAAGAWTVRDDDYNASDNYDVWTVEENRTAVDWTWGDAATDGGVFSGLGSDATVTVTPAFNEQAALSGQYYNGTVTGWEAVSNETVDGASTMNRTALDMTRPLTIAAGDCASVTAGDDASTPSTPPTDGEGIPPTDEAEESTETLIEIVPEETETPTPDNETTTPE